MPVTTGDSQIFGRNFIPKTVEIPKMIQQTVREVRFRQENGMIHIHGLSLLWVQFEPCHVQESSAQLPTLNRYGGQAAKVI